MSPEGKEARISKDALLSGMDAETLPLRFFQSLGKFPMVTTRPYSFYRFILFSPPGFQNILIIFKNIVLHIFIGIFQCTFCLERLGFHCFGGDFLFMRC